MKNGRLLMLTKYLTPTVNVNAGAEWVWAWNRGDTVATKMWLIGLDIINDNIGWQCKVHHEDSLDTVSRFHYVAPIVQHIAFGTDEICDALRTLKGWDDLSTFERSRLLHIADCMKDIIQSNCKKRFSWLRIIGYASNAIKEMKNEHI